MNNNLFFKVTEKMMPRSIKNNEGHACADLRQSITGGHCALEIHPLFQQIHMYVCEGFTLKLHKL